MTQAVRTPRWGLAVGGFHVLGLTLLALQLWVRRLPPTSDPIPAPESAEAAWWGLWPVTYLPPLWFWAGVCTVLTSMVWGWWLLRRSDAPPPRHAEESATKHPPSTEVRTPRDPSQTQGDGGRYLWPLVSIALLVAFFAFPIVHTRWGDAYILNRTIAWPTPDLRLTHSWQAPLDVRLHSQLWLWGHASFDWVDAMPVYRLLSPLAGALYLLALLGLSRDRNLAPAWLSFGLLASLGLLQLFFGYIENYSFAAAGILLFLLLGRRVVVGSSPLWHASLALGITNATHPSTVVLAPALLYLGWVCYGRKPGGTTTTRAVVTQIVAPMALCAAGTVAFMELGGHGIEALLTSDRPGGGDASWFVPLFETRTRWESYTLLSWPHLRDLLNQQALVAPVVLPSLLWLALWRRLRLQPPLQPPDVSPATGQTLRFFATAALCHLLLITVWNPDYGGQRDWDLFSLQAVSTAAWLVATAQAWIADRRVLVAGLAPLVVLQATQTATWVYQNTLPWEWP